MLIDRESTSFATLSTLLVRTEACVTGSVTMILCGAGIRFEIESTENERTAVGGGGGMGD